MKKLLIALCLLAGISYGASIVNPPGVQVSGTPTDGNILIYTNGILQDSLYGPTNLVIASTNAAGINVADAGGNFTSSTVEGVLGEIADSSIPTSTWATVSSAATNAVQIKPVVKMYILGGQSNALGNSSETPALYNFENDKVFFWYHLRSSIDSLIAESSAITNLYPVQTSSNWGPELSLGAVLSERSNGKVCIVKVTKSGGTMHTDFLPPSGYMYQEMTNAVINAKSALESDGYTVEIERLYWLQGESDAASYPNTTNHYANFTSMISSLETDLGVDKIPFTAALINDRRQTTTRPIINAGYVRAAKELGPDNYCFITTDCDMLTDYNHYTASGLYEIGERFANCTSTEVAAGVELDESGGYYVLDGRFGKTFAIKDGLTHWIPFDGLNTDDIIGDFTLTRYFDGSGGNYFVNGGVLNSSENPGAYSNMYYSASALQTGTVFSIRCIANIEADNGNQTILYQSGTSGKQYQFVMGVTAGSPIIPPSAYGVRLGSAYKNNIGLNEDDIGNRPVDMIVTTDGVTVKFYMNGELISSSTDSTHLPDIGPTDDFHVLAYSETSYLNQAEGYVYDIQTYSRALSADEVRMLYAGISDAEPIVIRDYAPKGVTGSFDVLVPGGTTGTVYFVDGVITNYPGM